MKKLFALLLALAMTMALTACDSSDLELIEEIGGILFDSSEVTEEPENEPETEAEELTGTISEEDVSADPADQSEFTETTQTDGSGSQSVEYIGGDFTLDEDGTYTSYEDVALYIVTYDHLPDNFMTKEEARELGWNGGGLDKYAYGMCIGGDYFGNKEGVLPKAKGRTYHECDIDTLHANKRGAERIVYSNDGLVYYTDDHYETFTLLYGEE